MDFSQSKTFRLFVSSTFKDFEKERSVLHEEIFPEIEEYCKGLGFTFQPIDLRWGVNEEAHLDQKTLDICLSEVRACKAYPAPNFLLMLGDRYGWVPLPYAIEEGEFNMILGFLDENEKQELNDWYYLDLNQIPSSYFLKERKDEYKESKVWERKESVLREILQKAVRSAENKISTPERYFRSATESELVEGVTTYLEKTPFQINSEKEAQEEEDSNIFGFFRYVYPKSKLSDKFIAEDYEKAQLFKSRVLKKLKRTNTFKANTIQVDESNLDYKYLKSFKNSVTNYLKRLVKEKSKLVTSLSPLELELAGQKLYLKQNLSNYIEQEDLKNKIDRYISDENREVLMVHGSSGSGKSSLLANTISRYVNTSKFNLVYRFVGATLESTNSIQLISILMQQLGIDKKAFDNIKFKSEVGEIAKKMFSEVNDGTIIIIDAFDKFYNLDFMEWVPKKLNKGVKMIISFLDDSVYSIDTHFFSEKLKSKSNSKILMPDFKMPQKLILDRLGVVNRTLQKKQLSFLLSVFSKHPTPLFGVLIVEIAKNWEAILKPNIDKKNHTIEADIFDFGKNQAEALSYLIRNVSRNNYHDSDLVQEVLGVIYCSAIGLTELDLLKFLSVKNDNTILDDELNSSFKMPMATWTRLYNDLRPYIHYSGIGHDPAFFIKYEELNNVIKSFKSLETTHTKLIAICKWQINVNLGISDSSVAKWSHLFANTIIKYNDSFKDKKVFDDYVNFNSKIGNNKIGETKIIQWLIQIWSDWHIEYRQLNQPEYLRVIEYVQGRLVDKRGFENDGEIIWNDILEKFNLSGKFRDENKYDQSLEILLKVLEVSTKEFVKDPVNLAYMHSSILFEIGYNFQERERFLEAIEWYLKDLKILKVYIKKEPKRYDLKLLISLTKLAFCYRNSGDTAKAIKTNLEALMYGESSYNEEPIVFETALSDSYNNMAWIFFDKGDNIKAESYFDKAKEIMEIGYSRNPAGCLHDYNITLRNKSSFYRKIGKPKKALTYAKLSVQLIEPAFNKKPYLFDYRYYDSLDNLQRVYYDSSKMEEVVALGIRLKREMKSLHHTNFNKWGSLFGGAMNLCGVTLMKLSRHKEAIPFFKLSVDVRKKELKLFPNMDSNNYAINLRCLSLCYEKCDLKFKALKLGELAYLTTKKSFNKKSEIYASSFHEEIYQYARLIERIGNFEEAESIYLKGLALYREQFLQKNDLFRESFFWCHNIIYKFYDRKNELNKAFEFAKTAAEIVGVYHNSGKVEQRELYLRSLLGLAYIKEKLNDNSESARLLKMSEELLESSMFADKVKWENYHSTFRELRDKLFEKGVEYE